MLNALFTGFELQQKILEDGSSYLSLKQAVLVVFSQFFVTMNRDQFPCFETAVLIYLFLPFKLLKSGGT